MWHFRHICVAHLYLVSAVTHWDVATVTWGPLQHRAFKHWCEQQKQHLKCAELQASPWEIFLIFRYIKLWLDSSVPVSQYPHLSGAYLIMHYTNVLYSCLSGELWTYMKWNLPEWLQGTMIPIWGWSCQLEQEQQNFGGLQPRPSSRLWKAICAWTWHWPVIEYLSPWWQEVTS